MDKLENFLIFQNNDGQKFVYSGLTGLILEYTQRVRNFLDLHKVDPELEQCLFVSKETKTFFPEKPSLNTIIIFITNQCNLKCQYCYERASNLSDLRKMDSTTLKDTIIYLLKSFNYRKHIGINFFGGEPLLNLKLIKESMSFMKSIALEKEIDIGFSISTNGTILNEEIVDFLLENNIAIQISIDGTRKIHNQNRPFLNGAGTFDVIASNVKKLSEYTNVSARVTIANYDIDLIEMYNELLNMGFSKIKIECAVSADFQNGIDNLVEFEKRLQDFSDYYIQNIKQKKIIYFTDFLSYLKMFHFGHLQKTYPCETGINRFAVATDGSIYFCHRFNNIPEFRWGDIYNGFENDKRLNFLNHHLISERCESCWAQRICGGTCYHASFVETGSTSLTSKFYCQFRKQLIEKALYIYSSLNEEDKIFLDNMSKRTK